MAITERLTADESDPRRVAAHRYRYRWAARFTRPSDVVLDAACGIGYGRELLRGHWRGVDRYPAPGSIVADLRTWQPSFDFDVFVGLETLEHLKQPENYVAMAKRAGRVMVISTPIVPTTHFNPFHVRDFTRAEVVDLFEDADWRLSSYDEQRRTYGLFAFSRRSE